MSFFPSNCIKTDRPAERPIDHSTAALLIFFICSERSLTLPGDGDSDDDATSLSSDGCRYLIRAGELVTLVHSHDPRKVPNDEQDICQFINRQKSVARMIFQVDEWASK